MSASAPGADGDWPSFRGRFAGGVAEGHRTPEAWDLGTDENVLWRIAVPGLAHSSPVIVGERLFLTTAESEEEAVFRIERAKEDARGYGWIRSAPEEGPQQFNLLCFDKRGGQLLWKRTAHEGETLSRRHPKGTHANATPAADEQRVVAYFGAEGLFCYDHEGELLWERDLGELVAGYYVNPSIEWGVGSSPILHDGRVIVLCDVNEDSFLASFEASTGELLWSSPRDDVPTWGTPTVDVAGGRSQVIVNGYEHIGGYDLETGEPLWTMVGGGAVPIPTPVVAHDLIFVTNAGGMPGGKGPQSQRAPIFAIRAGAARGEITVDNHVEWATHRGGNYIPTPLVYGDELYCLTGSVLTCYEARTGRELYRQRVGGSSEFSASPVAADGKVYLATEEGTVHVLRAGAEFEVLASNEMEGPCMASPAISGGVLYFRTLDHLVAVGDGTLAPPGAIARR